MRKILAAFAALTLGLSGVLALAAPASAHTPNVTSSCSNLNVTLTSYGSNDTNTVKVTIDDNVKTDQEFDTSFSKDYALDSKVSHTYEVVVKSSEDPTGSKGWTKTFTGTTTPCQPEHTPVTLCHATPPATAAQGWNVITVDDDAVVKPTGHNAHDADIIPPFSYYEKVDGNYVQKEYLGKNWDASGQAIYRNGCEIPDQPKDKVVVETNPETQKTCDNGVETRDQVTTTTTPYVWEDGEWVLDSANAVVEVTNTPWEFVRNLTGAEKAALGCNLPQPPNDVKTEYQHQASCVAGNEERSRTATVSYTWNSAANDGEGAWEANAPFYSAWSAWSYTGDLSEEQREEYDCDIVIPANPNVELTGSCGVADVTLSNLPEQEGRVSEEGPLGYTYTYESAYFTITVDGVATTDDPIEVKYGDTASFNFPFDEDSGDHTVVVTIVGSDEPPSEITVGSDCKPPVIVEVTAPAPGFTDPTCDLNEAGLNLPDEDGIVYTVDGTIAPGETVTVTASLAEGVENTVLVGITEWTHTYGDKATDCGKTPPPAELPGTGAGDILPWAGLGIVLLLSGLLAYMVTNRRRSSSI